MAAVNISVTDATSPQVADDEIIGFPSEYS
jgi:hypothetical protein